MTTEASPAVLLIDLSSLFWAAWHRSANESLSNARNDALSGIHRCIREAPEGSLVAICCDLGRSFRKEIAPEYKAQRPEKDHAALGELDKLRERLRSDGMLLLEAQGFEADDVIATATKAATAAGHSVVIASSDKDLLQLVGDGVMQLRTHTFELWTPAKVVEKFGVQPAQLGDWLALVGDASDNIKGARGVGPKTATGLLQSCGNLREMYRRVYAGEKVTTPAALKSLTEDSDQVEMARKLVTLRDDAPIDFSQIYVKREPTRPAAKQNGDDMDKPDAELDEVPEIVSAPATATTAAPDKPPTEKTPGPQPGPTAPVETRALVPATYHTPYELQLEPTSPGTAYKMAVGLFESRLYQRFQTVEAIWAIIIRGREMGLGALTALDCFHMIEGKPAPHAYLIIARAKADPDCEYFQCIETTATTATWETKNRRNPRPTLLTYTLEQARIAGRLDPPAAGKKPGNWFLRPDEMVRKTAGAQLARLEYPRAALGLYSVEELE